MVQVLQYLTSSGGAGGLLIDQAANWLYFIDNHPTSPYIGRLALDNSTDMAVSSVGECEIGSSVCVCVCVCV